MNTSAIQEQILKYEHSPQIFERRRNLFPTDDSESASDSELGHISPLSFDSECEVNSTPESHNDLLSKTDIGDYDILEIVDNHQDVVTPVNTKSSCACSDAMSPLYLSPFTNNILKNTLPSSNYSPSQNQKTPHDTSSKTSNVPKLVRKSFADECNSSLKRKSSPLSSPGKSKTPKLDQKSSKVRTALFPPEVDISVSTKSFYPKNDLNIMEKPGSYRESLPKSVVLRSTRHYSKIRRIYGQINNGVKHKIRKPKQNKIRPSVLVKATRKMMETNSALDEYMQDLTELKTFQLNASKLINQPLKLVKPQQQESLSDNKENINFENKKQLSTPLEKQCGAVRKFFKSSTRSRDVASLNHQMTAGVDNNKMTVLGEESSKKSTTVDNFDTTDLVDDEEPVLPVPNIDDILTTLNKEMSPNRIVLEAYDSVISSENSIQLHPEPSNIADIILSPISQMCDVTSGLALGSPRKCRNLTTALDNTPDSANVFNRFSNCVDMEKKLFPIFCAGAKSGQEKKETRVEQHAAKKFKGLSKDQMLLDAGQKKFGAKLCAECGIVYHQGDPGDELMHLNYHNAGHVLRFAGWKNEHIVSLGKNNRIIRILSTDSKIWLKKAKDLMEVVNKDLGCYEMEFDIGESQVYLYIKNKTIVGCAVAQFATEGHKMLKTQPNQPDMCSEEKYPVKCGISRIWVSQNYRKQGIATALVNSIKNTFMYGQGLTNNDIAITPPTEMGKEFAKKFFQTENFLIYYPF